MKNNISLSLKKTLRIALPCLALSLFAVSCSEDDSATLPESTTIGKTISFTAVASELTEDYATRVGLDKDRIPSSDLTPEPVIWLEGDKFAFNFVKYGETTGQVIEFTATDITKGGLACTMTADINLENGLYQVYVLTPNTSGAFQGDAVSGTVIDLRGQSQPGGTDDYSNLSDYYYQSAYTIFEIKDNEIITGSTNLKFTGLTSMLRYQITSDLSNPVTVKKIKISHLGTSESQFYTRGYFDPSSGSSIIPAGSPVSALSMLTEQPLNPSSVFNAYMTLIPTPGFASDNLNQLSATVYFDMGGNLYKRVWSWDATLISNNGTFPVASRYMFDLTLKPDQYVEAEESELVDIVEDELPGGDYDPEPCESCLKRNGFEFSKMHVNPNADIFYIDGMPFVRPGSTISPCPTGWQNASFSDFGLEGMNSSQVHAAIFGYGFWGFYSTAGTIHYPEYFFMPNLPDGPASHFELGGFLISQNTLNKILHLVEGFRVICRRPVSD